MKIFQSSALFFVIHPAAIEQSRVSCLLSNFTTRVALLIQNFDYMSVILWFLAFQIELGDLRWSNISFLFFLILYKYFAFVIAESEIIMDD